MGFKGVTPCTSYNILPGDWNTVIDRINKDRFEAQCRARKIELEELASLSGVPVNILQRAIKTGYIRRKALNAVCEVLEIEPKQLTRRMPISIGGISGLD